MLAGPVVAAPAGAVAGFLLNYPDTVVGGLTGAFVGLYVGPLAGLVLGVVVWSCLSRLIATAAGAVIGVAIGVLLWSTALPFHWATVCAVAGGASGLSTAYLMRAVAADALAHRSAWRWARLVRRRGPEEAPVVEPDV
jgi:hypothetical protein